MWHSFTNQKDILEFLKLINYFHDSCIKEMKYISGAYVDEDLSMYPLNSVNTLIVLFQRQSENISTFEIEFSNLEYVHFFPVSPQYTCEILDATLIKKDDLFYWCDSGYVSEKEIEQYDGNVICASMIRWRSIEHCLGQADFYQAMKTGDGSLSQQSAISNQQSQSTINNQGTNNQGTVRTIRGRFRTIRGRFHD